MSDYSTYSIVLLELSASEEETDIVRLTNAGVDFVYGANTYTNSDGLSFDLPAINGSTEDTEGKITNIFVQGVFLSELSNNAPFSTVRVKVIELDLDFDSDAVLKTRYIFDGLVYQVQSQPLSGYMNIVCKDWKYYTDITAGVPCTEQCSWQYFGGKGCGASVHSEVHTVSSVSGLYLDISSSLTNTTPLLFNKGYVERGGIRIKIKYHSTGSTFQLTKAAPSSWEGQEVTLFAGCDRSLATCRNIHNNEGNFLAMGYAMIAYNALTEDEG